ncbi:hypothetical protein [Paracoccus sp. 22332]|uniref:hypothetical protein n=1 Tax=Paracoccus sp. 22332 TaxID=3453913 RepID=UPI003F84009E
MNLPAINPCVRSDLGSLRGRKPKLEPVIWTSGIIVNLNPDEWVDITDPAACIPPAHVAAAAMKKDRA